MYAIRNKKDKRWVSGFDRRYRPARMIYCDGSDTDSVAIFTDLEVECCNMVENLPNTVELVKVEVREVE